MNATHSSTIVITGASSGISSLASLQPVATQAAYCASKAGLSMYLKAARLELKGKGITVTDILPGYIDTGIVEGVDISKKGGSRLAPPDYLAPVISLSYVAFGNGPS